MGWRLGLACLALCQGHADSKPITAHDLVTVQDIDGLSLSPDGQWAAFQLRQADPAGNRYRQTWYIVPTAGGPAREVGEGGEAILEDVSPLIVNGFVSTPAPVWSADSRRLMYLRRDKGRTQIWRSNVEGGPAQRLTNNESDIARMVLSSDRQRIYFTTRLTPLQLAGALAEEGRTGYRFDARFAPIYGPHPLAPATAPDKQIWVYDLREAREQRATQEQASEYAALGGPLFHSATGQSAWLEVRDPARKNAKKPPRTVIVRLSEKGERIVCESAACTSPAIDHVWWRTRHELLFMTRSGPGNIDTTLYAWKPAEAKEPRRILATSGQFPWPLESCGVARDRLVCFYEEQAHPRRLVSVHLDHGQIDTLFDPNPQWKQFDLGPPPKRMIFRSPSGAQTFGFLALPPSYRPGERLPLIVVLYRCSGFMRGGTGDEYPVFPFAAQGFAVLCYNVLWEDPEREARMSATEYENWFRGPGDPGRKRVQEGLDIAVAELDRLGIVDPSRVGLTGLSFGADTVKYALFNMKHLAAAILSSTPVEPASTFNGVRGGREMLRRWGLDSPTSERWKTLALSRNAGKVRAPLLMNVADREFIQTLEPYVALENAGKAVEMYVFPDEYHIKWQPAHRFAIYTRNIDWMNFWLRGVEDADPVKAPQYERWRAMRGKRSDQ